MKRSVMAVLGMGMLVLSAGIATMAVNATSDGADERPAIVQGRPEPDRHLPAERSGGVGFTEGDTVMSEPSADIDSEDNDAEVDASETASDDEVITDSKPGLGAGSGDVIKNSDPVKAGGLRGGVVLRDDPAQMGGAGGLCSPPHHDCNDLQSPVLAGGLRGGVVLGVDPVEMGGLRGGVVLNTDLGLEQ